MERIDWAFCQRYSEDLLSEAIHLLLRSPEINWQDIHTEKSGNYIISETGISYYIGEADNLSNRLKQQFNPKISSFYKNYMQAYRQGTHAKLLKIDDFKAQVIETDIGRKEVEEFGIVNIPTRFNKFQIGKREKSTIKDHGGIWVKAQKDAHDILSQGEMIIWDQKQQCWPDAHVPSSAGLYLVINGKGSLIYIGESSDISERYATHSTRTYFSALRRHIGTEILEFKLLTIKLKKRYFSSLEDSLVTEYLSSCKIIAHCITFGRFEIEKYLIKKHKPLLNRKDKI